MYLLRQMSGISVVHTQLVNNTVKNKRRWSTKTLKTFNSFLQFP